MPEHDAVHSIDDEKDRDAHIRRQKARRRPLTRKEDVEPVQQTQQREHDQRDVRAVRLHERGPRGFDVLREPRFAEAQVDDAAADPADESTRICEVDKPVEDDRPRTCTIEVGEGAEEGRDGHGIVGHALFRTGFEDARCRALDGEGVEAAARDIEKGVTGAPGGHDDNGVHDAGKGCDARILDADDEWG